MGIYREKQGFDLQFIADILQIDQDAYQEIEKMDFSKVDLYLQESISKIFGVDKNFFMEKSYSSNIPDGFARSYAQINEKDQKEINKLISFRKMYMKEKAE